MVSSDFALIYLLPHSKYLFLLAQLLFLFIYCFLEFVFPSILDLPKFTIADTYKILRFCTKLLKWKKWKP
ncbi:hypothetical protein LguiA_031421 [Lonicera macranthoides]